MGKLCADDVSSCGVIGTVNRLSFAFAGALLFSCPAGQAHAQSVAARTVLAAVVDARSRPVVDVSPDDFVVKEGEQEREVLDVHVADYPLALLLDDRPGVGAIASIRSAARRFIQRVGERPIALFRLSDATTPLTTLDDARPVVLDRVGALAEGTATSTSPLDTVANAAAMLKDSGAPFSAVVIVAGGPFDATAAVRGELLPQVIESGAAVHVVQAQPASTGAMDAATTPDLLKLIAEQTRGQFTPIFSSASYDAALDRLADRLAIELMLQYLTTDGPSPGDVRVGIRRPGAQVVGLGVR